MIKYCRLRERSRFRNREMNDRGGLMDCDAKPLFSIQTPPKHKYRVFIASMDDTYWVVVAWLVMNGDLFEQLAGAMMMR